MTLAEHLRDPGLARLFAQVQARLEREPDALPAASTSLRVPTDAERSAIGDLLGRHFRGTTLRVRLADSEQALTRGTGHGLVHWLE